MDLPDGIVECCQRFVNGKPQKIDVISALTTPISTGMLGTKANDHPEGVITHIFLNARGNRYWCRNHRQNQKKIRDKVKSRIISTISSVIAALPTYESNLCEVSIDVMEGRVYC